jgi:hypothetical protein
MTMVTMRKTQDTARELGCSGELLYGLIRRGRMPRPGKDSSGDLVWNDGDLEAARAAIRARYSRRKAGAG